MGCWCGGEGMMIILSSSGGWIAVLWSSWREASLQTVAWFPGSQERKPITFDSSVVFWSVCHGVSWHMGRWLESPWCDSPLASHLSRVASLLVGLQGQGEKRSVFPLLVGEDLTSAGHPPHVWRHRGLTLLITKLSSLNKHHEPLPLFFYCEQLAAPPEQWF